MRLVAAAFVLTLLTPLHGWAHAEGEGKVAGDYKIEFALIPEEPQQGVQQSVLLTVEDLDSFEPVADVPLWVRVQSPEAVVFSSDGFVSSDERATTFSFALLDTGEYTVDIRPNAGNDNAEVASFSFVVPEHAMDVENSSSDTAAVDESHSEADVSLSSYILYIMLGLIAVVLGARLGRGRQRHDEDSQ